MASFSSIISLIVVLLAAYAYAVPVVLDLPATTVGFEAENVTILARRQNSDDSQEKRSNATIGLSSSESDSNETTQTTGKVSERDVEDSSVVPENERDVAEDLFSTEKTERGIEVEPITTLDETSVPSKIQIKIVKRNLNQPWLAPQSDDQQAQKRSVDIDETSTDVEQSSVPSTMQVENAKRSLNQPWLAPQSDEQQAQKRSLEMGEPSDNAGRPPVPSNGIEQPSGPSTSEIHGSQTPLEQSPSLTNQASEQFNKRAITLIKRPKQNTAVKRDTDPSSLNNEQDQDSSSEKRAAASVESVVADELSTVISVRIQPEATTDEQSSSSTVEYVETSSTSEYDTTVVPVEEYTTVSSIPHDSTSKILAIIPGQISKTEVVVQPVTEKPAVVVRSFENVRLSEATHATILKEKKPNN